MKSIHAPTLPPNLPGRRIENGYLPAPLPLTMYPKKELVIETARPVRRLPTQAQIPPGESQQLVVAELIQPVKELRFSRHTLIVHKFSYRQT